MSATPKWSVTADTRPEEAVKLAMEREKLACEFYLHCVSVVKDPGVRKMFEFLAGEEGRHKALLEKEYDRFIAGEN